MQRPLPLQEDIAAALPALIDSCPGCRWNYRLSGSANGEILPVNPITASAAQMIRPR
ncbi:MAG: hypothetical protein ACU83N_00600 [Gammaproteobacteria bacterium]